MREKTRGLTLVEVLISLGVLMVIALAIYALLETGTSTYNTTTRKDSLQQNGRNALDLLAEDVRISNPDSFTCSGVSDSGKPRHGTTYLKFQKSTGFSAGVTTWGTDIEYFVESSSADSNNNGVVDEGRLVRTYINDKGKTVKAAVCDYLEPGGFTVVESGDTLTITLKLLVVDGAKPIRSTATTTILRRNKPI